MTIIDCQILLVFALDRNSLTLVKLWSNRVSYTHDSMKKGIIITTYKSQRIRALRPVHTSAICQSVDKRQKTERLTEKWTDSQKQIIICSVFSVGQIGHICWHLWRQMPFCSVHSVGQSELKKFQLFSVDRSMWVVFFLKMMRAFLKILVKFGNYIMYLWNWELSRKIYKKFFF